MSQLKPWLTAVGLCGLVTVSLITFKITDIQANQEQAAQMPEFSQTVQSHKVGYTDYTSYIKVLGKTVAPQQLMISNEYPGKISQVNFASGQKVNKGHVLIRQDVSEEQARLRSAQARAKLASTKYKRLTKLRDSNAINQNDLDQAESELSIATADIELLKVQIAKKTIRALFAGQTGIHQLHVGQYLPANSKITQLVANQNFIWIDFNLPQVYDELEIGNQIKVNKLSQNKQKSSALATIIAVSPVIAENTHSVLYRAKLELADLYLTAQSVVELEVPVSGKQKILSVPNTAIQHSSQGSFVYLLNPNEPQGFRAKKAFIKVQEKNDRFSIIAKQEKDGIKEGDVIASIGAFKLFEGALAFVANPKIEDVVSQPKSDPTIDTTSIADQGLAGE